MGSTEALNLIGIPWPLSILRCNRCLNEMSPGGHLQVTLSDPDAKDNLTLLLTALEDYSFELEEAEAGFLLHIKRRREIDSPSC
jgi:TusA-related sulfurtransferase